VCKARNSSSPSLFLAFSLTKRCHCGTCHVNGETREQNQQAYVHPWASGVQNILILLADAVPESSDSASLEK